MNHDVIVLFGILPISTNNSWSNGASSEPHEKAQPDFLPFLLKLFNLMASCAPVTIGTGVTPSGLFSGDQGVS